MMARDLAAAVLFCVSLWPMASQALCPQNRPNCGPCATLTCVGDQWECSRKALGTACDDGNACTYGDHCDNGVCTGTAIACSNTPCSTQSCNGTSQCTVTLFSSTTVCRSSTGVCVPAEYCT